MVFKQPLAPDEDLPFGGVAGRGVRVAVIDSGVSPRHPHIGGVAGGASVGAGGGIEEGDCLSTDTAQR